MTDIPSVPLKIDHDVAAHFRARAKDLQKIAVLIHRYAASAGRTVKEPDRLYAATRALDAWVVEHLRELESAAGAAFDREADTSPELPRPK